MLSILRTTDSNLRHLFSHRIITLLAQSCITGFGVIFVYQVSGERLWVPVAIYGFAALFSLLLAPYSGVIFNSVGSKSSMIIGVMFRIIMWASLLLTTSAAWPITLMVYSFTIAMVRLWYWPVYNNLLNLSVTEHNRTTTLGWLRNIANTVGLFMPLAVGFLISQFGFTWPLLIGTLGIGLSLYPLFSLAPATTQFEWGPRQVWRELFTTSRRRYIISEISNGFEGAFAAVLWPIVIYLLLAGDYLSIGIITSATTLVAIALNVITGRLGDQFGQNRSVLRYASWLHSLSWIGRIIVETAMEIFAIRSLARVSSSVTSLSLQAMSFDYAGQDKSHGDEMMIIREMALNIGRCTAYLTVFIASFYIPLRWLFILAAISVLILNMVPDKERLS